MFIYIEIYNVIFHRETYGFAMNSFVFSWCNCNLYIYFRYVVLTTSGGIMDHEEARRKHLGGKILGFFF